MYSRCVTDQCSNGGRGGAGALSAFLCRVRGRGGGALGEGGHSGLLYQDRGGLVAGWAGEGGQGAGQKQSNSGTNAVIIQLSEKNK